jgi:hypothetical protein
MSPMDEAYRAACEAAQSLIANRKQLRLYWYLRVTFRQGLLFKPFFGIQYGEADCVLDSG